MWGSPASPQISSKTASPAPHPARPGPTLRAAGGSYLGARVLRDLPARRLHHRGLRALGRPGPRLQHLGHGRRGSGQEAAVRGAGRRGPESRPAAARPASRRAVRRPAAAARAGDSVTSRDPSPSPAAAAGVSPCSVPSAGARPEAGLRGRRVRLSSAPVPPSARVFSAQAGRGVHRGSQRARGWEKDPAAGWRGFWWNRFGNLSQGPTRTGSGFCRQLSSWEG